MILGLDISTSIVGATIVSDAGEVITTHAWDMRNKNHFPDIYSKYNHVQGELLDLLSIHKIKHVFVEQSLQMFRSGFSSAKTLSTLASFNGIVSWFCYEIWNTHPEYLSATSARKSCGIKVPKGMKAKKVVIEYLVANEADFSIEYTKHGNPKPHEFDRADFLVIAKAGYNSLLT